MKKQSKNATLKKILAVEAVVLVVVCVGVTFLVMNWDGFSLFARSHQPVHAPTYTLVSVANPFQLETQTQNPVAEFSLSTINTTPPDNILKEITFYGGGGGGIPCSAFTKPYIYTDVQDEELMILNFFRVCGLSSAETLVGKIHYPDGRTLEHDIQPLSSEDGETFYAELAFKPKIDDPEGVYSFSLEGKNGKIASNAYYRKPDGPRLFKLDNTHILLTGFAQQENVKLYVYKHTVGEPDPWWRFTGWKEFKTGGKGQLVVYVFVGQKEGEFDNNEGSVDWPFTFVAVGKQTGEVPLLHNLPFSGGGISLMDESISGQEQKNNTTYLQCSTEQLSQSYLLAKYNAMVVKPVAMYGNPRNDARQVYTIPATTVIHIEDGPYCKGAQVWWRANVNDKKIVIGQVGGYILEKDGENYFAKLETSIITNTPTVTPLPTNTPSPTQDFNFSLDSGNTIPPDDILEEIAYSGTGGGPDVIYCRQSLENKTLYLEYGDNTMQTPQSEIGDVIKINACGWKENEKVKAMLTYPDGRSESIYFQAATINPGYGIVTVSGIHYKKYFPLGSLLGRYKLIFLGESGTLETTFFVYEPSKPSFSLIPSNKGYQLVLLKFQPREQVRLFAYGNCNQSVCKLASWQSYQVDENGNLYLSISTLNAFYILIGESSGELNSVNLFEDGHPIVPDDIVAKIQCGNGLMSRLYWSLKVRVAFVDGTNLRVRAKPGFSQEVLGTIPEGTIIYILKGPQCADGSKWWRMFTNDGLPGWVAEYQNATYLLEPAP